MNATITKKQAIATMIKMAIDMGKTEKEAIDIVCGIGTYDKLVSDLYDGLRAKAKA